MIVPFRTDGPNVPLAVAIDARTGQYRQSVYSDDPQAAAVLWSDPALVLRSVVDAKVDLGEPLGRVRLRRDAMCVYPHLVWRPGNPCPRSILSIW